VLCVGFSHFGSCPFQCLGLLRVQGLELGLLPLVESPRLPLFWALLRLPQLFLLWWLCIWPVLQCSGSSIKVESGSCLGHWDQRLRLRGLLGLYPCLCRLYRTFLLGHCLYRILGRLGLLCLGPAHHVFVWWICYGC